jgi:hypothetical protein
MTKFIEALPLMLASAGVLVACGGSASETPPPLEPTSNPRAPYAQTSRPVSQAASKPEPAGASDGTEPADEASEGATPLDAEAPEVIPAPE